MHDITDSENLERLRDQFFAAAAHALKTPVAVIKANAQLMSRTSGAQHLQSMAAISRQCSRIDRMVQNMLVLSRARSQSLYLHFDEVELAPLVAQVAREMAAEERRNDIRAEAGASPVVLADPERLALVLRNVIAAAQRESVAGTPVTVRVTQDGQDAQITVGYQALPAEEAPFAAADEYDNLAIGGSVAKTIVEAHGGALRAERSGPDASACIRLPVSMEASP
jgi:signal transduction histidine kinase